MTAVADTGGKGGQITGNLLGAASMLVWAAGFPAAEELMTRWPLPALVTGRFVMAMLALVPLWLLIEGWPSLARARWARGMLIGAIGFGGGAWMILLSQAFTDPVSVAIFAAATPLCATVVDWIWLRRGFSRSFLMGLVAAIAGGIVATGGGMPGNMGLGALFAVLSGLMFSWGTLMTARDLPGHSLMARTSVTTAGATLGALAVLGVLLLMGQTSLPAAPFAARDLGLLAVYGVMAFALSQFLWVGAADRLGVAIASFHVNVAPFYTMLILLVLGGDWSWRQAAGAGIVALGVVLAQRRPGAGF